MRRHWLLTITIGGQVRRYSVDEVEVIDADGETWLYASGLSDLQISESLSGGSRSTAIEILDERADWAEIVATGGSLDGGAATLLLWTEGTLLEEAEWMAGGIVDGPEYGAPDEPLTLSIVRLSAPLVYPAAASGVSADTWPVTANLLINPRSVGVPYPVIFGAPGKIGGVGMFSQGVINGLLNFSGVASSPAYVAEYGSTQGKGTLAGQYLNNYAIIADRAVTPTTVVVWPGADAGYAARLTVVEITDGLGRTVSGVRSQELWAILPDGEYWVGWESEANGIATASSVLIEMLQEAGEVVDLGRFDRSLDGYRLDFALTERVDPHEWASAHLGDLLPLALREGKDGVWYEVVRWASAGPADVVAYLDGSREPTDGTPVQREGRFRLDAATEVVTRASLKYRRYAGGLYAGQIQSDASATYATDLAERSPVGVREAALSSDVVDDDATAGAMLSAYLAWRGIRRRSWEISGGTELAAIGLGAVIAYTESEVSMNREVCIVVGRAVGVGTIGLELVAVDRPTLAGHAS